MIVKKVLLSVEFTPEEVNELRIASQHHYDGVCRMFAEHIKPNMTMDWHDFDILSKICESPLAPELTSKAVWSVFETLRHTTSNLRGDGF